MPPIRDAAIHSVKWAAIEKFSVQGIQFIISIVLARILSPSDYGAIGMLSVFIAVSQTFVDSGFSSALIRKQVHTEEDFCTAFYFNVIVGLICYAVLFLAAPYIARFYRIDLLCPVLRIQALSIIINSFIGVQVARLTICLDFKALAKRSLVSSLLAGILGIFLAYQGCGVWSLVGQNLCTCFINLLFIQFYCRWIPRKHWSKSSFKELFGFGSNLLAAGLLTTIYNNLNPIVIGRFFSSSALGFYSRGTNIATLPVDSINGVLSKVTYPLFAKIQDDDAHLVSSYRKYICITSMCIFYGCCLMASLGKPLVLFLLTDKWSDAIIYLQIFSFAIMFDHICSINLNLIKVKGRSDIILKLEIIKRVISVAILFASIPFGVIGICVSKIIYTQIAIVINTYYNGRLFGMGYWSQVKDFLPFLVYSLLACVPSFALSFADLPNIVVLIVGALCSTAIYYLILHNNQYMKDVVSIVLKRK